MKKFERLPLETRKKEIQTAALHLFNEFGFANTTMEKIIANVSLSKGGVYRIYSNPTEILKDLILSGMHLRNAYYQSQMESNKTFQLDFIIETIVNSLFLYPDISKVYVEFLWEKQRNPELEALYQEICKQSIIDTTFLLKSYNIPIQQEELKRIADIMNATILSLHTLHLFDELKENKEILCQMLRRIEHDRF